MLGTVLEKIKKVYGRPNVGASGASGWCQFFHIKYSDDMEAINFATLGIIQSKGGIFYDLGSGTGKPVIGAAVYHNFDVCYGSIYH